MNRWVRLAALGLGGLAVAGATWGAGWWNVARSVNPYAKHWGERPEGRDGVLHYVALGDSLAQGIGARPVDCAYVPLVAQKLSEFADREVILTNLSVSGATSADLVRDQLPAFEALPFTPDVVTLDIGGNDVIYRGHTEDTFRESFRTIVEALPAGSFVADVPWIPLPRSNALSIRMAAAARELAEAHGHYVIPFNQISRSRGAMGYHTQTATDFFHPNNTGHRNIAEEFWRVMEPQLEHLRAVGTHADQ